MTSRRGRDLAPQFNRDLACCSMSRSTVLADAATGRLIADRLCLPHIDPARDVPHLEGLPRKYHIRLRDRGRVVSAIENL
jgi:hypothetical protein